MTAIRRFGLVLSVLFFSLCLTALALLAGLYGIFNTPEPLKNAAKSSGIYEEITPYLLARQEVTPLPLSDPDVQEALEKALPAEFYEQSSEKIINGTYSWVHGGTKEPEFSIDMATVRTHFADNIAAYVRKELRDRSPCKKAVEPPTSFTAIMLLDCIPPFATPSSIAQIVHREALRSELLFKGDTLSAATLKNEQGKSFAEQFAFLQGAYHSYVILLVTLPLVALLFATAIAFWSKTKKVGVKRASRMMLVTGLVGVVLSIVSIELIDIYARVFGLPFTVAPEFEDKVIFIIETLAASARPMWVGIFVAYAVLAIALLVTVRLHGRRQKLRFSSK